MVLDNNKILLVEEPWVAGKELVHHREIFLNSSLMVSIQIMVEEVNTISQEPMIHRCLTSNKWDMLAQRISIRIFLAVLLVLV